MSTYSIIQQKIAVAAKLNGVAIPTLVAVSKTKSLAEIMKIYNEGQRIFGENYVQECIEKKIECDHLGIADIDFHFIGHLQSNKVKTILPYVSTIHSVDSLKIFAEIQKRACELRKKIAVYFQINIDREESKGGFSPEQLTELASLVKASDRAFLQPMGLMAIPDPESGDLRKAFQEMQALSKKWEDVLGSGLSMGMSGDYETAIAHGSSVLRIGSALFGSRL